MTLTPSFKQHQQNQIPLTEHTQTFNKQTQEIDYFIGKKFNILKSHYYQQAINFKILDNLLNQLESIKLNTSVLERDLFLNDLNTAIITACFNKDPNSKSADILTLTNISRIPDSISDNPRLKKYFSSIHVLNIYHTALDHLPPKFAALFPELWHVNIQHNNNLCNLPDTIVNWTHLGLLYLSNNNLSELPSCLSNTSNFLILRVVDISYNNFKEIPNLNRKIKFSFSDEAFELYCNSSNIPMSREKVLSTQKNQMTNRV